MDISSTEDLMEKLSHGKDLRNYRFIPERLSKPDSPGILKIEGTTFENFSFSKTAFERVYFLNCTFKNCLFIGSSFINCEIHNCKFLCVNPYKIIIKNTYINPKSFDMTIPNNSYDKANIAVHLYQELYSNSIDSGQISFSNYSNYLFKYWSDEHFRFKWEKGKPYKVGNWEFIKKYPLNLLHRYLFGYGLRLRNFILTFLLTFSFFFFLNYFNWNKYDLTSKDATISCFKADTVNLKSNFFYTLDVTTKLIDSQIQPQSNIGMFWLSVQSIGAFVLLSSLITVILNKFVR